MIAGGGTDDSEGFFVEPTVIETDDPSFRLMRDELFGPVVTAYVYPEDEWEQTLELVDDTAPYGLTGAVFAQDRGADRRGAGRAALRGRELLRQRQADRRGRRPAAVRRRARVGHERQGRLDVEPDPLGQPADDQGDVRPAARLPLPVPGRRERRRVSLKRPLFVAVAFSLVVVSVATAARIHGTAGPDRLQAVNGVRDLVSCGRGYDLATVDGLDRVARDCEMVTRQTSRDPYENGESQHETEVEPDSAAFGKTVVAVFQVGRIFDGGARNIGFAVSRDSGRTWRRGFLPGLTAAG